MGLQIYNISAKEQPVSEALFRYSLEITADYSNLIVQENTVFFYSEDIKQVTILDTINLSNITVKANWILSSVSPYPKIAVKDWLLYTLTSTELAIYIFTNYSPLKLSDA